MDCATMTTCSDMRSQRLEDIAVKLRTGGHATTDVVKLNVGGEQITVSRAALLRQLDAPLAALFKRSHELPTDVNGAVFIDRDARYFLYVIDYLRNGCPRYLHGLPMENSELERIKQEFVYFGLPVPINLAPSTLAHELRGPLRITLEAPNIDASLFKGVRALASATHLVVEYSEADGEHVCLVVWGAMSLRQLHVFEMPSDIVHMAAYNNVAAIGHSDGLIRVVDLETGQLITALQGGNELVHRLDMNENLVAAVDITGNIRIWDSSTWSLLRTISNCQPRSVALYERSVIAKRDSKPHMFDVATGDILHVWDVEMDGIDIVVVSGSDMLISSSHTDEFRIVDLAGDLRVVRTVVRALASECKNMIGLNYVRGTKVLLDSDRPTNILLHDYYRDSYTWLYASRDVTGGFANQNLVLCCHDDAPPTCFVVNP